VRSKLGFASLQVAEPDSEHSDAGAVPTGKQPKAKKKKKKKTRGTQELPMPSAPASSSPNPSPKKDRKSKAKKLDDIDLALQELALKARPETGPYTETPGKNVIVSSSAVQRFRELLSTSLKHLDGDTELRRFFGSKVVHKFCAV